MMTGSLSRNVGKLFSGLKLVTDNLSLHLHVQNTSCFTTLRERERERGGGRGGVCVGERERRGSVYVCVRGQGKEK